MGGKGSGGQRLNAGRKSKDGALALVHGSRDRGTRPVSSGVAPTGAVDVPMPLDLPEDQAEFWQAWAPLAHAKGKLTPERVPGFRHLGKCAAVERALLAEITKRGWSVDKVTLKMDESGGGLQVVETKANDLITKWQAMLVRVENGMARFLLTGDGKDIGAGASVKEPSALEKLQAQAKAMKRAR
jgi:hypothetical protein